MDRLGVELAAFIEFLKLNGVPLTMLGVIAWFVIRRWWPWYTLVVYPAELERRKVEQQERTASRDAIAQLRQSVSELPAAIAGGVIAGFQASLNPQTDRIIQSVQLMVSDASTEALNQIREHFAAPITQIAAIDAKLITMSTENKLRQEALISAFNAGFSQVMTTMVNLHRIQPQNEAKPIVVHPEGPVLVPAATLIAQVAPGEAT